jgi:uncharacterized phage protein gp47/JayE
MELPVQTFAGLVQQMAAAVQGGATQLIDLTVESVLRALLEGATSVALWLQWMVVQVLTTTRAATSTGADLDSWMADFSLTRLPGGVAAGTATFSRYTTGIAAVIPVGCQVGTQMALQQFVVVAQASNPAWNGTNGYIVPATLASVDVPIAAPMPGAGSNVQSGAISVLMSPIPGIDQVSNAQPISGGTDPESDAALRARFALYINSRSLGTRGAVLAAVASAQPGLRYAVLENQTFSGAPLSGHFCVIVDEESGEASSALLAIVQAAVESVRPIGSTYAVSGPAGIPVSVALAIQTSNPSTHLSVAQGVQAAIIAWISQLPFGGTLAISKLDAIAHDTDPSVLSVPSTLINNANQDLTIPPNAAFVVGTVAVT